MLKKPLTLTSSARSLPVSAPQLSFFHAAIYGLNHLITSAAAESQWREVSEVWS